MQIGLYHHPITSGVWRVVSEDSANRMLPRSLLPSTCAYRRHSCPSQFDESDNAASVEVRSVVHQLGHLLKDREIAFLFRG